MKYLLLLVLTFMLNGMENNDKKMNKDKILEVHPLVVAPDASLEEVEASLETQQIPFFAIETLNWKDAFAYLPAVRCRIAYDSQWLYLQYVVKENSPVATFASDRGARSWEDSCVEFFLSPESNDVYYNLEMTCIGVCLLEGGKVNTSRTRFPQEVTSKVKRLSSLGNQPFGVRNTPTQWQLTVKIPWSLYALTAAPAKGSTMTANFYKCGDETPVPHYVSWAPIDTPHPSFHQPSFFGTLLFL